MSVAPLGPPPPPDPQQDAQRRARARRVARRGQMGAACALGQFLLSFVLGGWAVAGAGPGAEELALIGAGALCFALAAAYGVTQGARLLAALVALALEAPSLLRRLTSAPRPRRVPAEGDAGLEPAASWLSVALHSAVLMALALGLALAFAWASEAIDLAAVWWRFALAALALTPFTRRALEVLWPEG
jgi:hypothetical protein